MPVFEGESVHRSTTSRSANSSSDLSSLSEAKSLFESRCPAFLENPNQVLSRLIEEEPIYWSDESGGWIVTRYEDVSSVLRNADAFSNVGTMTSHVQICAEARAMLGEERSELRKFLANTDAPEHTRLRGAIARALTPRAVAQFESYAREAAELRARGLADLFAASPGAPVDFGACFAEPYPLDLIGRSLGVPPEDHHFVARWVGEWFDLFRFTLSADEQISRATSVAAFDRYVSKLIDRLRTESLDTSTILGELVNAVDAGEFDLSDEELCDLCANLIVGGIHTTTSALLAVMLRLLTEPGAWSRLVADPDSIPNAVEECLRIDGIAIGGTRFARRDVDVGGFVIRRGQTVKTISKAADIDPAMFDDPMTFRPDRQNVRRHLVFGNGVHHCVGASLARLELTCAVRALVSNVPEIRVAREQRTTYVPSPVHRRVERLLVCDRRPEAQAPVDRRGAS
jgi:cytochrome P450